MKILLFAVALVLLSSQLAMAGTNYNVCFNSLDADLDGVMSKREFMIAFSSGDVAVFETADQDRNGDVNHTEWETYKESQGFEETH